VDPHLPPERWPLIDVDHLPVLYTQYRARYTERDERYTAIDEVVRGDFSAFDPDDESLTSSSPNLIQVALEDTAEAASVVPTIRVTPHRNIQTVKKAAEKMERICAGYAQTSKLDLLIPQSVLDMAAFGLSPWVVWPDVDQRIPLIEKRDPRTCYPEPGYRPGEVVQRCMFAREVYYSQLPAHYQVVLADFASQPDQADVDWNHNVKVVLVEYFDADEYVLAGLYSVDGPGLAASSKEVAYVPVELERIANRTGVCPVVLGSRITLDGEFRGQFDQVVDVLKAHIRLQALLMDYADQAVYSDVWVKDLIGEMPFGGGSYIELGPNGAIGRIQPAVSSMNVQQDLAALADAIHLGGRWPKSRPGEVDQSIASAKFLEASAGMMNTAIRTYHMVLSRMITQAMSIALAVDKKFFPGEKTTYGVMRNQEFLCEYDASDIVLENKVRVEYGLGLGRDPAQAAVLHLQYAQAGFISKEFVQENIDGVTDVAREQARIDTQDLKAMMLAKLLAGVESGEIPERALLEIIRKREEGESLADLFEEYVIKPKEEAQAGSLQSGLDPSMMLPAGAPPGAPGIPGPPPGAPGAGEAPPVPGAPAPPEILARLGVPAGPGGLLGSQVQG
jgi:hypothetical protein